MYPCACAVCQAWRAARWGLQPQTTVNRGHSLKQHYTCYSLSSGNCKSKNWFARERENFFHVGGIFSIPTARFRKPGAAPLWGRGRWRPALWERRPGQVGGRHSDSNSNSNSHSAFDFSTMVHPAVAARSARQAHREISMSALWLVPRLGTGVVVAFTM